MSLATAVVLVVVGLALLAAGGEALVRAATTIAGLAGVSPAVIGLTVVAMGTSVPELAVSLLAAWRGEPDIAIGNVVGSNIFNVAPAIGLTAMIRPLPVLGTAVRREWPVMFAASVWCLLAARDGWIDLLDGVAFVAALTLFVAFVVRLARRELVTSEVREIADHVDVHALGTPSPHRVGRRTVLAIAVLVLGVGALVAGGRLLVDGAVSLARVVGMTERQIALTIVAGGTGAPELATSLIAAIRRRTDVAVANMIGSNIFNILGILGVTAIVAPVRVSPAIIASDMRWMIGTSLLLLPALRSGWAVRRWEGTMLTLAYVTYVWLLLRR